ncbi:hypothetical protein ASD8599_02502 [Ascidiaceihabitans donghaensis]|uniref:Uncharacterized protein n=1 Tax=Ascidiaceihabitans donghaensis TaxID=1510460 RepID=A0A2R8BF74_9RHOB|nr:hypothetical protein ASD8599_02502 [Ascidiaceihabitans donghaensis]
MSASKRSVGFDQKERFRVQVPDRSVTAFGIAMAIRMHALNRNTGWIKD